MADSNQFMAISWRYDRMRWDEFLICFCLVSNIDRGYKQQKLGITRDYKQGWFIQCSDHKENSADSKWTHGLHVLGFLSHTT